MDENSILFTSLIETLRKCFQRRYINQVNLSKLQGDFFCVLLDKTPIMVNFPPPDPFDKSRRTPSSLGLGRQLFPPIYDIDTMDIFRVSNGLIIQDGSSEAVSRLFCLGRPLWGSRYDTNENISVDELNDRLHSLVWKETGGEDSLLNLALFSYRIDFYIGSDALARKLVNGCMRYVMYISETQNFLRTIQPSEPILAYVASLNMKDPSRRVRIISQFITSCMESTVNIGDMGEVTAAALILQFSFDEAHNLYTPNPFLTAIPLSKFTGSLFGRQAQAHMSKVLQTDTDMRALWQNGRVFFNHMVKLEKVPNEQTLELGFERGAAFFLPDGFRGADILVPIQVSSMDLTFFLIQVKNRKDDKATASLRCQASEASHVNAEDGDENSRFQIVLPRVQTRRSRRQETSTTYWPTTDKSLVALVMGFDAQTYPSTDTCMGQRTEESARVVPLLQRLLDCIPRASMPDGTEDDYVRQIKTLAV